VDFFDFVFTRYLGITKHQMKIMGQHLAIISRSAALRDTLTLEEDPEVSEYLSEYILLCREIDRCYNKTAFGARSATG
jgi:hypothetical protein